MLEEQNQIKNDEIETFENKKEIITYNLDSKEEFQSK